MTHTPGPWFRLSGGIITRSVLADHSNGKNFVTVLHEHTRAANARIIAAAPELLEACIKAESFMKQITPKNDGWHSVQDLLRAAIRKAEEKTAKGT